MANTLRVVVGCCAIVGGVALAAAEHAEIKLPKALPGAHAHNDYYHKRPLWDALQRGFVSIEADVFLVDGRLLVGHYRHELRPERTLESLYLEPLRQHVKSNDGRVFAGGERLTLLVDFKTPGAAAYEALDGRLSEYGDLISPANGGSAEKSKPVQVIVTGDRPIDLIRDDADRRVALDGRLAELDLGVSADVMPLVSESWTSHFKWRGGGPMPEAERERLREIVNRVHDQGRLLRFWATPDKAVVWKELRAAGVDLIGADDLAALEMFLRAVTR